MLPPRQGPPQGKGQRERKTPTRSQRWAFRAFLALMACGILAIMAAQGRASATRAATPAQCHPGGGQETPGGQHPGVRPFEMRRLREPGTSTSAPRSWATRRSTSKPCRQPTHQGSKHGRATSQRASTPGSCTSSSSWRRGRTSWSSTRQRRNP